eukprot:2810414-Prymnesium_polylepis.1
MPTAPSSSSLAGDPTSAELDGAEALGLLQKLEALQQAHQLEVERKVELERTVDNSRQQIRSLTALHSAEKQQVAVLREEIEQLRALWSLQGRTPPAPTQQAANAQAAAEARAQAAAAQLEA